MTISKSIIRHRSTNPLPPAPPLPYSSTHDPRSDPQPGDELRGINGQLRSVIRRDGDILWCQDGAMRYKMTVQRWQKHWRKPEILRVGQRDPRMDPQSGDEVRVESQTRCVIRREHDIVIYETGLQRYRIRLQRWQEWFSKKSK